jgi:tetratricopeptide (TPR) repeat protein
MLSLMSRMRLAAVMAAVLVPALAAPIRGQQAPRRPRLASDADTNDAVSYYQLGVDRLERNPDAAAAAFYWATRLDPLSAHVWYGQYVAQLAHNASRLVRYVLRETRTMQSPEVMAIDSLRFKALALDPFVRRGLEEPLLKMYAHEAIPRDQFALTTNQLSDPEQVRQMESYFQQTDPYLRGLFAYGRGEMGDALRYIGNALASHEIDWMWAERAAVFFEVRQLDSARANMSRAVELAHGGGGGEVRHVWETRAAYLCALGRILEETRNWAGAREAYQDAYAANAAFYPALLRIGILGLRTGDTASALQSLRRVTEIVPNDFFAQATLGAIMHNRGQRDSAVAHLRRATEIEPLAAGGWLLLGRAYDAAGDTAQTIAAFQRYLALAPRNDAARLLAGRRLEQLQPGPAARP